MWGEYSLAKRVNILGVEVDAVTMAEAVDAVRDGDVISVDADTGAVADKTTGECFSAQPFPPFIQEIINEGGLVNRAKRQVAERRQDKR